MFLVYCCCGDLDNGSGKITMQPVMEEMKGNGQGHVGQASGTKRWVWEALP